MRRQAARELDGDSVPAERLSVEKSTSAGPGPGTVSAAAFRWLFINRGRSRRDIETCSENFVSL